jgi:tetratricopeptide (TPR) repeat protein
MRKGLLVLFCLATLSVYLDRVAMVFRAQSLADSTQGQNRIADLERSIRMAPGNAEFPNLLGIRLSASHQESNLDDSRALANLRTAAALNPNRAQYWLDLASRYQFIHEVEKEHQALESALNAEPENPEIMEEAGELLLAGDPDRAFPLFKRALEKNPEAGATIIPLCWTQTPDTNLILSRVIPANPELQFAFLRLLAEQRDSESAAAVWQFIVAAGKQFPAPLSFFYFDYLLKEQDAAAFDRGWHELAGLAPEMQAYLPNENRIVNASFERPLLNSGLDWRHEPADHIAAGIDYKVAHSGGHSLSLSFDGNPAYDAGWIQFVPVQPNADYEFSAWIQSQDVTTSSGPRFALVDAFSGVNLLLTEDVLDTHPWHEIKGTLHVPAETQLLAVKIVRAPANTRIRGRVWIDDLRLTRRTN